MSKLDKNDVKSREGKVSTFESEIFGLDNKVDGFVVVDRKFSSDESLPSFMLSNINPVTTDVDYNLERIKAIADIAANSSINILVFPELSISGYVWNPGEDKSEVSEHLRGCVNTSPKVKETIDYLRDCMASSHLDMVVLNNVRIDEDEKLYNTTFIIGSDNDYNECSYDKIFLTPVEKEIFQGGNDQRLVVDTRWGRFGITVCYDLCFVGMGKKYSFEDEVDAVINSAAWRRDSVREYPELNYRMTNYYEYIWDLKHCALASHNQIWSIGCTCVGVFDKTKTDFCGGSGFWSPSGIPVLQASKYYEELLILRNLDITKNIRNQAVEDFDYSLDHNQIWKNVRDISPKNFSL